jgi:hypothetical protein
LHILAALCYKPAKVAYAGYCMPITGSLCICYGINGAVSPLSAFYRFNFDEQALRISKDSVQSDFFNNGDKTIIHFDSQNQERRH